MNDLSPITLLPLLCGGLFVVLGFILLRFPPKYKNFFYGYRTKRSKQSEESWLFAQNYASRLLIIVGVFLAASSAIGFFVEMSEDVSVILGGTLVAIALIIVLLATEMSLKNKFGKN